MYIFCIYVAEPFTLFQFLTNSQFLLGTNEELINLETENLKILSCSIAEFLKGKQAKVFESRSKAGYASMQIAL